MKLDILVVICYGLAMMDVQEIAPLFGSVRAQAYGKLRQHLIEAGKLASDLQEPDWVNVYSSMVTVCDYEIRSLLGPI